MSGGGGYGGGGSGGGGYSGGGGKLNKHIYKLIYYVLNYENFELVCFF